MRWTALAVLAACGCGHDEPRRVLLFTHAQGSLHEEAIAAASSVLPDALMKAGIESDLTEDTSVFASDTLARYQAVVFLYYTGNGLIPPDGRTAFEDFVTKGGGAVEIHSASVAEPSWPFFQQLLVTPFVSHPDIQQATVDIADPKHEAVAHLPAAWVQTDEWYNFAGDAGSVDGVDVLATVDETTYTGGTMGAHHPIIWAHDNLGGRSIFTALGHAGSRWSEPDFVEHMVDSIRWAVHD